MIKPDPLWMFGVVAEPLSVMAAGFLMKGKWKPVLALNGVMLAAYFIHPFGRLLPPWTILDVLLALLLIYPAARLGKKLFETDFKLLPVALILISFISIATDSLVRIFLLIPAGIYSVFPDIFGGFDGLYAVFIGAAVDSYIEDLIVVAVSVIVGAPLLLSLSKFKLFRNNSSTKKD
jgi:hypothetical protein